MATGDTYRTAASADTHRTGAIVGTTMAAVLMFLNGLLAVAQGIAAIAKNDVFAAVGSYAFKFNIQTWGWIHLVIGLVVLAAAFGLYTGSVLARGVGVGLTLLTVVANFLYLPYQPFWSVIMIGLGLFVLWALFHDVGPDAL